MKSRRRSLRRWKTFRKLESRRKKIISTKPWWKDYSDGWQKPKPWNPTTFEVKNPSCFTVKNDSWNDDDTTRKRRDRMEERFAFLEHKNSNE